MSFAASVCMIWWCFAGFEACVAMGEEIKYPRINIPRALFLAPFVVFAVNALFQWFLIAITPAESLAALATAQAPYADAMKAAGILGLPLALLAAGVAFGGDFSTMNAAIATIPRYLFTMARDGVMPGVFAKTSRFQTPHVAIITLGALTMALIATDSLIYIASLSLFADLLYYVIGILAAWALRRRRPDLQRPYRAPLVAIGAPVSALIYLYMMTQLDTNAFITGDDVANAALNFLERGWNGENFHEVTQNLRSSDPYMVMADFKDYRRAQADLQRLYADREKWAQMSLKNTANSGIFSADRSVLDYARDIWHASAVK